MHEFSFFWYFGRQTQIEGGVCVVGRNLAELFAIQKKRLTTFSLNSAQRKAHSPDGRRTRWSPFQANDVWKIYFKQTARSPLADDVKLATVECAL